MLEFPSLQVAPPGDFQKLNCYEKRNYPYHGEPRTGRRGSRIFICNESRGDKILRFDSRSPIILSLDTIDYIHGLKPSMTFHGALCVHGCPPESMTTYLFELSKVQLNRLFLTIKEEICFVGHTHELEIVSFNGDEVTRVPLQEGSTTLKKGQKYQSNHIQKIRISKIETNPKSECSNVQKINPNRTIPKPCIRY